MIREQASNALNSTFRPPSQDLAALIQSNSLPTPLADQANAQSVLELLSHQGQAPMGAAFAGPIMRSSGIGVGTRASQQGRSTSVAPSINPGSSPGLSFNKNKN